MAMISLSIRHESLLTFQSWSWRGWWGPRLWGCCRGWLGQGRYCTRRPRPRPSSWSSHSGLTIILTQCLHTAGPGIALLTQVVFPPLAQPAWPRLLVTDLRSQLLSYYAGPLWLGWATCTGRSVWNAAPGPWSHWPQARGNVSHR